jgi:hypothetical protein
MPCFLQKRVIRTENDSLNTFRNTEWVDFSTQPDEWMGLAACALPTIAANAVESNGSLSQ